MKNNQKIKGASFSNISILLLFAFVAVFAFVGFVGAAHTQQLSFRAGKVINTTTSIAVVTPSTAAPAFQNGAVVNFVTYSNSSCFPTTSQIYPNSPYASAAAAYTGCVTGSGAGVYIQGATPRYNLIPSFAGFSVYGNTSWGATAQGYPTYNGMTIVTQCGAAGTPSSCSSKVPGTYFFSPQSVVNEQSLGIMNGLNGAPEGALPSAAHDFLLPNTKNGTVSRSYRVTVAVYDPNIFPNATTGKCTKWVASNQSNATQNCLTSIAALQAALMTRDTAVAAVNSNNKLWSNAGNVPTQAAIIVLNATTYQPSATTNVTAINTNLQSYSYVSGPYTGPSTTTVSVNTTTVAATNATTVVPVTNMTNGTGTMPTTVQGSQYGTGSSSNTGLYIGIVVVIVILVLAWWMMSRNKK